MRILLGPMKAENEEQVRHSERRLEDSFCFYEKDSGSYEEIAATFPEGWKPDVIIHWSLEYYVPPKGIETADCLTVGIFGDWNLGARAIQNIGGAFDVLFADRSGCELLQNLGFKNVHYARLWGYDAKLHRRLPETNRDIDILMVGNLNHIVQRERSFWAARVAKLSRRHNVMINVGIYGEDYVRMMNRAKIVFNKTVGGGINMRAYESMACGALLFNERDNAEIRDIFTDREHCVLYGDDDLEELLDYYLAPENTAEREKIAQAGWERVQEYSDANRMCEILDKIEILAVSWKVTSKERGLRTFETMVPVERELRRLFQAHLCNDGSLFASMNHEMNVLSEAIGEHELKYAAETANAHAALVAEWGIRLPSNEHFAPFQKAKSLLEHSLSIEPNYITAQINLGYLHYAYGHRLEGAEYLKKALYSLESSEFEPSQLRGVVFPHRYERFDMEMERVWGSHVAGSTDWGEAMRTLCKGHIHETLAQSALQNQDFSEAVRHAKDAIVYIPNWGEASYILACAHRGLGNIQEAHNAFKKAIAASPFLLTAWQEDAQLLIDLGRGSEAAGILEELVAMINGCPFYAVHLPAIETLLFQAKLRAARQTSRPPLRLLALPNWNDPENWQPLIRKYVLEFSHGDSISLMLPVTAKEHPRAETMLEAMIHFLEQDLKIPMGAVADVILMTEPLESVLNVDSCPLADLLVLMGACDEEDIAVRAGIPTLALDNLNKALILLPAAA